jgi:hypothetical protein
LKKLGNNNLSPTEGVDWLCIAIKTAASIGVKTYYWLLNIISIYLGGYHIPAGFKN